MAALGLGLIYAVLPADGGTGDLASFEPEGFRVQWVLERSPGGLEPGDVIVRAGGRSLEEWLAGASAGPRWETAGSLVYEIIRSGRPQIVLISPRPVRLSAVAARWATQPAIALALLVIGA